MRMEVHLCTSISYEELTFDRGIGFGSSIVRVMRLLWTMHDILGNCSRGLKPPAENSPVDLITQVDTGQYM